MARIRAPFLALALSLLTACGSGGSSDNSSSGGQFSGSTASVQHVIVVVFENQNYSDVIGSPSMPFYNSVAQANGLGTQFFADFHPSLGNYIMMTAGQNPTGNVDNWQGTVSGDTVASVLASAGKTWKVYAESIPSAGYLGGDSGLYIKHHNPFAYFSSVINNSSQAANIVPFSQFSADVSSNALPSYSFVVPNNRHNGHDCPDGGSSCPLSDRLSAIDSFLNSNFASLLQNSSVMSNSLLLITFDEANNDNTNGGGRIPVIVAGGKFKTGYQSTTRYQFPSLLRFSLESLGVTSFPGASASAPSMSEFLK